jgi:hypothetical protein
MTANVEPELCHSGLLGCVLAWVRAHVPPDSDLAMLSREDLLVMAKDLSLAESDLLSLRAGARDNTVLMERMMRARGLDPDRMRDTFGASMRDLERVCTRCRSTGRCRRELDADTAALHCYDYCPNAATFDNLVATAAVPTFP